MLSGLYNLISLPETTTVQMLKNSRNGPLTLVNVRLHIVKILVLLIGDGVDGSASPGRQLRVRVLGHILIGLLGGSGTGALDSLRDVVGGVLYASVQFSRTGTTESAVP